MYRRTMRTGGRWGLVVGLLWLLSGACGDGDSGGLGGSDPSGGSGGTATGTAVTGGSGGTATGPATGGTGGTGTGTANAGGTGGTATGTATPSGSGGSAGFAGAGGGGGAGAAGAAGGDPGCGGGGGPVVNATPINVDQDVLSTLVPVDSDEDFYSFNGTAGDLVYIDTAAKPEATPFSPNYPDLVITLYDECQQQIAENDDPFLNRDTNDSELYTVLPATGQYYLRVQDCLSWDLGGPGICNPAGGITNFDYGLRVSVIAPNGTDVVSDPEGGDDETSAAATGYTEGTTGVYYASLAYGTFNDDTDVDVFAITLPANLAVSNTSMLDVAFNGPEGTSGCGTTNNVGMAWLEDGSGNVIVEIDHSLGAAAAARRLRAPIAVNTNHFLFLEHPGATAGANDFYLVLHHPHDSNPLEVQEAANGNPATAESLAGQQEATRYAFYVYGEMTSAGDEDHFLLDASGASGFDPATWTAAISCSAERSGSGVRGLSVQLLEAVSPYAVMPSSSGTETAAADLFVDAISLGTASQYIVKLGAGTPDPSVQSRYYICGFHFQPPGS